MKFLIFGQFVCLTECFLILTPDAIAHLPLKAEEVVESVEKIEDLPQDLVIPPDFFQQIDQIKNKYISEDLEKFLISVPEEEVSPEQLQEVGNVVFKTIFLDALGPGALEKSGTSAKKQLESSIVNILSRQKRRVVPSPQQECRNQNQC